VRKVSALTQDVEKKVTTKTNVKVGVTEKATISPRSLGGLLNNVIQKYNKQTKGEKITSISMLEKKLNSDPKFKEEFMGLFSSELKEKGIEADPEATLNLSLRYAKRRENFMSAFKAPKEANEEAVNKLMNLYNSLAERVGETSPMRLYNKYTKDQGFRTRVNSELKELISSDPELNEVLGNESPDKLVHGLTQLKMSYMSKREIIRDLGHEAGKGALKGLGTIGMHTTTGFGHMFAHSYLNILSNAIPGLQGAPQHSLYALNSLNDVFGQLSNNARRMIESHQEQMHTISYDQLRDNIRDQLDKVGKVE